MALEIERKFLVKSEDFKKESHLEYSIKQGFLNTHAERTVRVRIKGNEAFLTVKGKSSSDGLTRYEWETNIEKPDAEGLLKLCEPGIIEKTRYIINHNNHIFEVDVFEGNNKGLIIAELELTSEDEDFVKPHWLGDEVTGLKQYYNSMLSKRPFKEW